MGHLAVLPVKEGIHPALGEIQQLAGDHESPRRQTPVQGSYRRKGKDLCDPQLLQGKDIGPIIDLMGRDTVVQSVPGQEVDFMAGSCPFQAVGTAKRRGDSKGSELSETGRILYTGAADDPDFAQSYHLFGFVSSSSESKSPRDRIT